MMFSRLQTHVILILLCITPWAIAMEIPIDDFSLEHYEQSTKQHLYIDDKDYTKPLLKTEYQQKQLQQFYNHYYSTDKNGLSPWSESLVNAIIPIAHTTELAILNQYNNQNIAPNERHYAENFKAQSLEWWEHMQNNMQLSVLEGAEFHPEQRAITITNTFARNLPDHAPDFFHASLPGQGFPFDNIQDSALWAGTPLYVLSTTKDKSWSLVLTPDAYMTWVKSNDIAYASNEFIDEWQHAAQKNLIAITHTGASVLDLDDHFQFTGYIGAVFPLAAIHNHKINIFIPFKNKKNQAQLKTATIASHAATLMPMMASKKNLARIIQQLQNRPYGWGGAFFLNDCSQELKSLFTPFGLWLPRNSKQQGNMGSVVDLSTKNVDSRLYFLTTKGHPLMTLVYIKGHIMLYTGHETVNDEPAAMSYQNIWGLAPAARDKRYVIGQSVFLPLLKQYPEHPDVASLAEKDTFKLIFLDELQTAQETPAHFAQQFTATRTITPE